MKGLSRSKGTMENANKHIYHSYNKVLDSILRKLIELFKGEKPPSSTDAWNWGQNTPKEKSQRTMKGLHSLGGKHFSVCYFVVHKGQYVRWSTPNLGIHIIPIKQTSK